MPSYPMTPINTVELQAFQEWTDQYGMVQDNDQNGTTGNGNLYLAHYVLGLKLTNQMTAIENARINQVYLNNFIQPGLLLRSPVNSDYQQHDDYFGMMGADSVLNPESRMLTKQMKAYSNVSVNGIDPLDTGEASANKWFYPLVKILFGGKYTFNTHNPGKFAGKSFLLRRVDLIATMQMALRERVNIAYWLYWAAIMGMLIMKKNTDHDANMMAWHSSYACEGYGIITNLVCKAVRASMLKNWGGAGQLLSEYFGKPQHPLVSLLNDKF